MKADIVGIASRAHALAAGRQAPAPRAPSDEETGETPAALAASGTHRAPPIPAPAAPRAQVMISRPASAASAPAAAAKPIPDDTLRDIYARETATHVSTVRTYLSRESKLPEPHALPEEVYRACHTLSGSSKMAQARHGIRLAEPLDHWLRHAFGSGLGLTGEDLAVLSDCMSAMESVATHLDESTGYFVNHWQLLERIERADKSLDARMAAAAAEAQAAAAPATAPESGSEPAEAVDFDPEVAAIFTDEATELIEASERALSDWRSQPSSQDLRMGLKRPLHTLKGGARMAGIMPMGDLSHELESLVMLVDNGTVTADGALFDAIQASLDELARMREQVINGRRVAPARAMIERLRSLCRPGGAAAAAAAPVATPAPAAPSAPPPPAEAPFTLSEADTGSRSMLAKFNAELMFSGEEPVAAPAEEADEPPSVVLTPEPVLAPPPPPKPAPVPPAVISAPAPAAEPGWSSVGALAAASPFTRARAEEEGLAPPQPVPPGREPVAGGRAPGDGARRRGPARPAARTSPARSSIARARLEQQLGSHRFQPRRSCRAR